MFFQIVQKINLKSIIMHVKNNDYCYVEMPKEDNKILKYNYGANSMKIPFIIYTDLDSLLGKWALAIIILKNYEQSN